MKLDRRCRRCSASKSSISAPNNRFSEGSETGSPGPKMYVIPLQPLLLSYQHRKQFSLSATARLRAYNQQKCCSFYKAPPIDLTKVNLEEEKDAISALDNGLSPLFFLGFILNQFSESEDEGLSVVLKCTEIGEQSGLPTLSLSRAYALLANMALNRGLPKLALQFIEKTNELGIILKQEDDEVIRLNLGIYYLSEGVLGAAGEHLRIAIQSASHTYNVTVLSSSVFALGMVEALRCDMMPVHTSLISTQRRVYFKGNDFATIFRSRIHVAFYEGDLNTVTKYTTKWKDGLRARIQNESGDDHNRLRSFANYDALTQVYLGNFRKAYTPAVMWVQEHSNKIRKVYDMADLVIIIEALLRLAMLSDNELMEISGDAALLERSIGVLLAELTAAVKLYPLFKGHLLFFTAMQASMRGNKKRCLSQMEEGLSFARAKHLLFLEMLLLIERSRAEESQEASAAHIKACTHILNNISSPCVISSLLRQFDPSIQNLPSVKSVFSMQAVMLRERRKTIDAQTHQANIAPLVPTDASEKGKNKLLGRSRKLSGKLSSQLLIPAGEVGVLMEENEGEESSEEEDMRHQEGKDREREDRDHSRSSNTTDKKITSTQAQKPQGKPKERMKGQREEKKMMKEKMEKGVYGDANSRSKQGSRERGVVEGKRSDINTRRNGGRLSDSASEESTEEIAWNVKTRDDVLALEEKERVKTGRSGTSSRKVLDGDPIQWAAEASTAPNNTITWKSEAARSKIFELEDAKNSARLKLEKKLRSQD